MKMALIFLVSFLVSFVMIEVYLRLRLYKILQFSLSEDGRMMNMGIARKMMREFWKPLKDFI